MVTMCTGNPPDKHTSGEIRSQGKAQSYVDIFVAYRMKKPGKRFLRLNIVDCIITNAN